MDSSWQQIKQTVAEKFSDIGDIEQAGIVAADMSRFVQGLVAGIGFLGAGTVLKPHDEEKVKGLTTASGIWMTAAIGMAAGLGLEVTAVISTLLALAIFSLMPWLVNWIEKPATKASVSKNSDAIGASDDKSA